MARLSGDFDTALAISFWRGRSVKISGADGRASGRQRHNIYDNLIYIYVLGSSSSSAWPLIFINVTKGTVFPSGPTFVVLSADLYLVIDPSLDDLLELSPDGPGSGSRSSMAVCNTGCIVRVDFLS